MTDKRKAPNTPEGRRKRAAPTIDLTATEVPPAEQAASEQPVPAPEQPAPSEPSHSEPPPQAEPAQAASEAPSASAPEPAADQAHRAFSGILPASIAAGFVGAIVAAALMGGLWWSGLLPTGSAARDQSAAVAALQKEVQALQSRTAPAPNNEAVDALRQTVRKLESDIGKLPNGDTAMAARLNAVDHAMDSLSAEIGKLNKRSDEIASTAGQAQQNAATAEKAVSELRDSVEHAAQQASAAVDPAALEALRKQVAALAQSLKSARAEIGKTSAVDTGVRLALSANALRQAVAGGRPYQAELEQAKSLGADAKLLAPLAPFAATGLPGKPALAQELRVLLPAMLNASGVQKAPAGFLERLEANASKIVRISPVNAPQGDDPSDLLARLEVEAAHDDIAAALADLAKLPDAARAPAQGFIAKVKARQAALAAARRFAASTAGALGEKGK
jgi:hypothetical protein